MAKGDLQGDAPFKRTETRTRAEMMISSLVEEHDRVQHSGSCRRSLSVMFSCISCRKACLGDLWLYRAF